MQYHDLDIHISPGSDGYQVRVDGIMGMATSLFHLPFNDLEIENFILKVGATRSGTRRIDSPQMKAAREFGQRLFDALLTEQTLARFSSSVDHSRVQQSGVRIRLNLQDAPELAAIPWEYIYNHRDDSFLTLSRSTPIVRFLELTQPIPPLTITRPLRILGIVSNPSDLPALDISAEKAHLEEALADRIQRGHFEITWLEQSTLSNLQRALRRNRFHIMHFVGHGYYDETLDEGALMFENEDGRGYRVSASVLGTLIRDRPALRLAVLNACEGARVGLNDPFSGIAPALLRAGLPAAVAMQFEITDLAAVVFAREFYGALSDGLAVPAALAEARMAIFGSGNDVEWGTPVLYSRVEDGILFNLPKEEKLTEEELDELYAEIVDLAKLEKWEASHDKWQQLRRQAPDYPDQAQVGKLAEQQVQANNLYAQIAQLIVGRQWESVLNLWDEIKEIDPSFADRDGHIVQARQALVDQAEHHELENRQKKLSEMYEEVGSLVAVQKWQEAQEAWSAIRKIDPAYPDPRDYVSQIRRSFASATVHPVQTTMPQSGRLATEEDNAASPKKGPVQKRSTQIVVWGLAVATILVIVIFLAIQAGALSLPNLSLSAGSEVNVAVGEQATDDQITDAAPNDHEPRDNSTPSDDVKTESGVDVGGKGVGVG